VIVFILFQTAPNPHQKPSKTLHFPSKNIKKRAKNTVFQPFLIQNQPFFTQKPPQNQSKNRIFSAISGIFGAKSVPTVPPVSLVP